MMTTYTNLYFKYPQSSHHLMELGFIPLSSKADNTYYKYRFPVEYWKRKNGAYVPTLFCVLTTDTESMKVMVDVKTLQDDFYPDFYTQEYGNPQPLLERIQTKIDKELTKLKIVEKKPRRKRSQNNDGEGSQTTRRPDRGSKSTSKKVSRRRTGKTDNGSRTGMGWKDIQEV